MPPNRNSNLQNSGKDKKSRKEQESKANKPTVLTFVDMSKLKYLSRSMNTNNDKLSRKKHVVELPKNTDVSIVEAPNEEDSDGETPTKVNNEDGDGSGEQTTKQTSP